MKTKPLFYLGGLVAAALAIPTVNAGPHRGGGGNRVASMPARGGMVRAFGGNRFVGGGNRIGAWNGQRFSGQRFVANRNWNGNWNGQHWNGNHWNGQHWNNNHWGNNWNWNHHHHHNNVVFVDFGFPFWGWWGYPYYYGYYPYGYGYYPYGSYGYGYYGNYNYNYGNGYGYDNGYGNGYSNGYDAKVAELQRRLANAGYYRGEIDGIWGSRTQYALKAYRHDHPNGNSNYGSGGHPTLRNTPYSPPPVTTEPTPTE